MQRKLDVMTFQANIIGIMNIAKWAYTLYVSLANPDLDKLTYSLYIGFFSVRLTGLIEN